MFRKLVFLAALALGAAIAGAPAFAQQNAAGTPIAPELSGLGDLHFAVTTESQRAQAFFNQGLRLLYAFNHQESSRAFREAARLDPTLAMAYWGHAMTLGPTLNSPMDPANVRPAHDAVMRAQALAGGATPRERALIDALARRYAKTSVADRGPLDRAYADAMRGVAARFPADPDVQTLFADALMNTMPWDYWQKDGSPKPDAARAIDAVERTIAAFPAHAGAHHYLIHLMEASNDPDRAVASADALGALMPAAGHMVHMPAHIYIRVGRYADAAEANVRAIAADEDYLAQCQAQGLYPVSYYPHNLHFLWAAATLEGRSAVAIEAARQVAEKTPHHHAGKLAWTADFPVTPMLAYARFGQWRRVLTEPMPPADQPYAIGIWRYARALAFVAGDRLDRADAEIGALREVMTHEAFTTTLKGLPFLPNLEIARRMAEGELAGRRGAFDRGVRLLEEAVALEDAFPYSEPPVWHHPPRQVLGAILLEAGRAADAERVYRDDLARFRDNGWSLFGLAQSLDAQNRTAEAAEVRARFDRAWKRSDLTLTSSRVLGARPAASKSVSLPSGVALEYVERGDVSGLPVVFLHGYTDSWRSFEELLPHLPASIRAIAVSQRGHGGSDRPEDGYTFAQLARDVRDVLDTLGLPKAVIVGHSMGGTVAERFALDFPDRTLGLVLLNTFASLRDNGAAAELATAVRGMTDGVPADFVRAFQQSTVARPTPSGVIDRSVAESLRVPPRVWRALVEEFVRTNVVGELSRIDVPALVVWGNREQYVTRADAELTQKSIPGATLLVYEGAGHAPHWEAPAEVAADLVVFFRKIRP